MEFKASQIAGLVNGEIVGDKDVAVHTFCKIDDGKPGAITFLANPKYTPYIYTTDASIVLVNRDFEPTESVKPTLIKVDNPYSTLSMLLDYVAASLINHPSGLEQPSFVAEGVEIPSDAYVGAFSYVGKGVRLGKGVKVYPQVYIGHNVEIGDNTILYPGVKVYYGCKIGSRCIIHSGAVIGADGFGFAPNQEGSYKKIPQIGNTVIEDDVEIGANTTVDRATMGSTIVRRGVKLDNLIQAAHNTEIGHDTVIAAQTGIAGSTKIGANCMIGGQVGFAGHIHIGDNVQAAAQSGVPHDVPSDSQIMGSPASNAKEYMRQTVYQKRLGDLFARVDALEKLLNSKN